MSDMWGELGIAPASDERTIRRAYARRLKETNPEDDAEGFQALRHAYEMALAHAAWAAHAIDEPEEARVAADGEELPPVAIRKSESPSWPAETVGPDPAAEARDLQRALVDAIQAGGSSDDAGALLEKLLAAPANDNLLFRDGLEGWTAELIAAHLPHSDPLVDVAVAHYRWSDDQYRALSPAVYAVLAWTQDRHWIGTAAAPDGQWGHGWAALTGEARPAWQMRILALRPGTVGQAGTLLHSADTSLPILYSYFDAGRVEWWRAFLARGRLSLATLGLLLAAFAVAMLIIANLADRIDETTLALIDWGLLVAVIAAPFAYVRFVKPAPSFYLDASQPPGPRDAWLAATLLLPLLSVVAPPGAAGMFAVLAAATTLVTWAWTASPFLPQSERLGERVSGTALRYWLVGVYCFFYGALLPAARFNEWVIVCVAAIMVWHRGAGRAKQLLLQADPKWRAPAMAGLIALLAAAGWLAASATTIGEGAYRASLFSLPCLGLMLLISGVEREQPAARYALAGWVAMVLLWFAAVSYAEPNPQTGLPTASGEGPVPLIEPDLVPDEPAPTIDSTAGEDLPEPPPIVMTTPPPPPPWEPPTCPEVEAGAPAPSAPKACDPDSWFRSGDYPRAALRRGAGGTVQMENEVSTEGRITGCKVVESSGHKDLDAATCALLFERGRFVPGRDGNGDPAPSKFLYKMTWVVEE